MKGLVIKVVRDDLDPFDSVHATSETERWIVLLGQKRYSRDGTTALAAGALTIGHGPDRLRALLDASATLKYLIEEVEP